MTRSEPRASLTRNAWRRGEEMDVMSTVVPGRWRGRREPHDDFFLPNLARLLY